MPSGAVGDQAVRGRDRRDGQAGGAPLLRGLGRLRPRVPSAHESGARRAFAARDRLGRGADGAERRQRLRGPDEGRGAVSP